MFLQDKIVTQEPGNVKFGREEAGAADAEGREQAFWDEHVASLGGCLAEYKTGPGVQTSAVVGLDANPALRFARRHLVGRFGIPRYGTLDEHPLTDSDPDALQCASALFMSRYPG